MAGRAFAPARRRAFLGRQPTGARGRWAPGTALSGGPRRRGRTPFPFILAQFHNCSEFRHRFGLAAATRCNNAMDTRNRFQGEARMFLLRRPWVHHGRHPTAARPAFPVRHGQGPAGPAGRPPGFRAMRGSGPFHPPAAPPCGGRWPRTVAVGARVRVPEPRAHLPGRDRNGPAPFPQERRDPQAVCRADVRRPRPPEDRRRYGDRPEDGVRMVPRTGRRRGGRWEVFSPVVGGRRRDLPRKPGKRGMRAKRRGIPNGKVCVPTSVDRRRTGAHSRPRGSRRA